MYTLGVFFFFLLLRPLHVDPELRGHLDEHLDAGQKVCEYGKRAARHHPVDVVQTSGVVVGVDAVLDHMQVRRDRIRELEETDATWRRRRRTREGQR
jgi:hypothetical protein